VVLTTTQHGPAEIAGLNFRLFGRMEAPVKVWMVVLLQSMIAVAGLVAYFFGNNVWMAGLAAGSAVALGIALPLMGARKQQNLDECRDDQHEKTLAVIGGYEEEALEGVIRPPLPHRPTVAAFLELAGLGNSNEQLQRYDDLITDICDADEDCPYQAAAFSAELTGNVLGVALEGLAALAVGDLDKARGFFEEATQLNSSWAMPWLGWATVCYQQGDFETIAAQHPHINGVELLCYDCGDEEVFMQLAESERDSLAELYQQTATALGNYYAAAEMAKSRQSSELTHEELRKAA
jgi:tetratricopeptide (TPR) repeat protein